MSPFPQSVADSSAVPVASGVYSGGHCSLPLSEVYPMAMLDSWIKCPEAG